jgi:hypothetical protein
MPLYSPDHELRCARCYRVLTTSLLYEDGLYWHLACWQEGQHLLANATRLAESFMESERSMSLQRMMGG